MSIGQDIYAAISAGLPDAAAVITTSRGTSIACICAGMGRMREASEMGLSVAPEITVGVLPANDAQSEMAIGAKVTLTQGGESMQLRVRGRFPRAGVVRYALGSES